jgi:hypothetical protein
MARNTSGLKPPWKKGDPSPNPSGRPKKRPITDHYHDRLEKPVPEKIRLAMNIEAGAEELKPGATWGEANALRRAMDSVLQDGHMASKEMREATEGKAPQRLEITTAPKTEITVRLVDDRTR